MSDWRLTVHTDVVEDLEGKGHDWTIYYHTEAIFYEGQSNLSLTLLEAEQLTSLLNRVGYWKE